MIEIITSFEQGGEDWQRARIGSIGGSSISKAVAKGKGSTRQQLLYDMAGEIISGVKKVGYSNHHMADGLLLEPRARALYCLQNLCEVEQVALIRDHPHKHFSPDALVGSDGIIEIKCVIPSTFVAFADSGAIPTDYRRQCQWGLQRSGRKWVDFVMYCDLFDGKCDPMIITRLHRDEKEIRELEDGADKFINDLLALVERVRGR